jgi:tetratricopeptide (TPR) repeat protein
MRATMMINLAVVLAAAMVCGAAPWGASAQQSGGTQGESSSKKQRSKPDNDSATKNAPDQPMWDPLRAEKDIEVGKYYMRKGDLDAAMDRFQDAAKAKPGYAIPFRYLGEAQEKKGMKREAIKSYTRYLDLYPHADDGTKIRKKIQKLWVEVDKKKKNSY